MLYFANIDELSKERCHQLLTALRDMQVCRRNRVFFSCVCLPGENISSVGSLFSNELYCLNIYITPLWQNIQRIPTMVNVAISRLNASGSTHVVGVAPDAMDLLCHYDWPHNYSQFRRVLTSLATTSPTPVLSAAFVSSVLRKERHSGVFSFSVENAAFPLDINRSMEEMQL